jgi:nicotinamide-nucleotide amidase
MAIPDQITVEMIAVGDELLDGTVADTNSVWLAGELTRAGGRLSRRQTVPDDLDAIVEALRLAAARSQLVVVSGGLGGTVDDRTSAAAAQFAGVELIEDPQARQHIETQRKRLGQQLHKSDHEQAKIPANARHLENSVGLAPGFQIDANGAQIVFLPGVPAEWRAMAEAHVLPAISSCHSLTPHEKTWKFFGYTESELAALAEELAAPEIELHFRASFPEIHLRASCNNEKSLNAYDSRLRERTGIRFFGRRDHRFSAVVNDDLRRRSWTLASAESCTGGLLSQMVTSEAGSSDVFLYGAVTYSNQSKCSQLGIEPADIEQFGAVSQPIVEAMARGARERAGATLGVAISGVAGPGGGSLHRPVGTVHLALANAETVTHHHAFWPGRSRSGVRKLAAYTALNMVRHVCLQGEVQS